MHRKKTFIVNIFNTRVSDQKHAYLENVVLFAM